MPTDVTSIELNAGPLPHEKQEKVDSEFNKVKHVIYLEDVTKVAIEANVRTTKILVSMTVIYTRDQSSPPGQNRVDSINQPWKTNYFYM